MVQAVASSQPTRRAVVVAGLASLSGLGGCSSIWPFSSGKARMPDLPPVSGKGSIRQAWSAPFQGGVGFQPALSGGTLWAARPDGSVSAFESRTGKPMWRFDAEKRLLSGVGTDGRIGVVAARDGSLVAITDAGKLAWSVSTGAEVVSVPAVGAGLVVVRSSDNRVSAFDAQTGARRWSFQRQGPPLVLRQTGSIAIDQAQAYVGLPGGRMVSLVAGAGAQRWEAAVAVPKGSNEIERIADIVGTPQLSGNDVCAIAFQGRLACLDTATGRTLWSREISSSKGIDLDGNALVATDDRGYVHAFARSGASLWRQEKLAGRGLSAPLLSAAHVVVVDSEGEAHLLSRDDGAILARVSTGGKPVTGALVGLERLAFFQTQGGALHALSFE